MLSFGTVGVGKKSKKVVLLVHVGLETTTNLPCYVSLPELDLKILEDQPFSEIF